GSRSDVERSALTLSIYHSFRCARHGLRHQVAMVVGPEREESITGSAVEWICWVLDRDPRRSRQRSAECGEYERGDERKGAKHGAFHGNLLKSFSSARTMPLVTSGFNSGGGNYFDRLIATGPLTL